jgi:GNAT superfamily N-acetyltransferase
MIFGVSTSMSTSMENHGRPRARDAVPADVGKLLGLVHALAEYEREPDQVKATEADLAEALFGADPKVFALVAENAGVVLGMLIYFVTFSTWTGRHGLYVEDLFVVPGQRRRGTGKALLGALADRAAQRGCARVEWAVLDWNQPAIDFYLSLGAVPMDEWRTFRLSGDALSNLAATGTQNSAL